MRASFSVHRMRAAQLGVLSSICVIFVLFAGCGGDAASDANGGASAEHAMANWSTSYEESVAKSKAEDKPMLMLFTGSDW